jgi:hypothetical protein
METIKMYITNLFQNMPETEEVLKAKNELLSMMEDKYNELKEKGKSENEAIGIVISEFGNIDELKDELGIENTMKNFDSGVKKVGLEKRETARKVSMDEATDFLKNTFKFSFKISLGVVLCITSVVPLIVLNGFVDIKAVNAIGLTYMFLSIAAAVALFIISGIRYEKYNYLKEERLELEITALRNIKEQKEDYKTSFAVRIAVGVVMCILSVIPIIIIGLVFGESNRGYEALGAGILLVIVAAAVVLFITTGMKMDALKQLLQEEEYSPDRKRKDDLVSKVAAVYWPLVVVIYFGWSFGTMDWARSWIVWPVAGILFAAVSGICNLLDPNKKRS